MINTSKSKMQGILSGSSFDANWNQQKNPLHRLLYLESTDLQNRYYHERWYRHPIKYPRHYRGTQHNDYFDGGYQHWQTKNLILQKMYFLNASWLSKTLAEYPFWLNENCKHSKLNHSWFRVVWPYRTNMETQQLWGYHLKTINL